MGIPEINIETDDKEIDQIAMDKMKVIKFKLSYLTMMILNMAYMKDNLQNAFRFDESIHNEEFSFMA